MNNEQLSIKEQTCVLARMALWTSFGQPSSSLLSFVIVIFNW